MAISKGYKDMILECYFEVTISIGIAYQSLSLVTCLIIGWTCCCCMDLNHLGAPDTAVDTTIKPYCFKEVIKKSKVDYQK